MARGINDTFYKDLDYHGLGILSFDDFLKIDAVDIEIHHKNEPPKDNYDRILTHIKTLR